MDIDKYLLRVSTIPNVVLLHVCMCTLWICVFRLNVCMFEYMAENGGNVPRHIHKHHAESHRK